ncbi:EfeM/EfeO family lipoprotein [Rugosimonospora africana]|uniref:Imelysin-like domain-containing protein n=1 Tax=Rugosimonospora africana TaxID=556532 RepID=A0A8J3VQB4_9ACTN|nr:EfeM/EfeO family lipoprotein [Rugosimonospora africana]GIH14862.1 hypothetical protein Raf01_30340 [Rugosimonospora africana]
MSVPTRRTMFAAATAVLAVAAALGAFLLPHHAPRHPHPMLNESRAQELTDGYRRDTVARIPGLRYTDSFRSLVACPAEPGRYTLSSRYDLSPDSAAPIALAAVRGYWRHLGYRIVNDTPGQNSQLLVENPGDGFRISVSQRTARYVRLAITSPCLVPAAPPVALVLSQDLATAREAYQRYVAGQLTQLAREVAALRTAVGGGALARARAAWLTAQLTWEHVGAAYGSFGEFADAIDGLPQGLPRGTADARFTGLHRVEYGLWHGEPAARLLPIVDALAADLARLRGTLPQETPPPTDLPLRAHEILEDAQRDHLTGLTDFGGGAGLAETSADVDATEALLDVLAPLVDARRPDLLPAAHAGLDALRQALSAARTGGGWSAPVALSPARRLRIDAALGGALETLAGVPGLLEVAGS